MTELPKLKCEKKTVIEVDYKDLEAYFEAVYGQKWCFCSSEEANNDNVYEYAVGGPHAEDEMDEWDREKFEAWVKDGTFWPFGTHSLMEEMHRNGLLEEGEYIIKVWW